MRSSPASIQTAEAEISINEWVAEASTARDRLDQTTRSDVLKPHYRKLRTRGLNNYDHLIKRLDRTTTPSSWRPSWSLNASGVDRKSGVVLSGPLPWAL